MTKRLFTFLFISILFQYSSNAQWQEVYFSEGAAVEELISSENYMWFFSGNSLLRTKDGVAWSQVETLDLAPDDVGRLKQDKNKIYLHISSGPNKSKVFYTDDEGQTWKDFSTPTPLSNYFKLYPFGNTLLYLHSNTVYRSVDMGGSWNEVFSPGREIFDIEKFENDWLLTTRFNIYRSTDDGLNWGAEAAPYVTQGIAWPWLEMYHFENVSFLIHDDSIGGIYRSIDNGMSWKLFYPDFFGSSWWIKDLFEKDGKIYMACSQGPYVSSDYGSTWEFLNYRNQTNCFENFRERVYIGTSEGVFSTTNLGESWKTSNWGHDGHFFSADVSALKVVDDEIFIGTFETLYKTKIPKGYQWDQIEQFWALENMLLAGDTMLVTGAVMQRTFDGGITWDTIQNPTSLGIWSNVNLIKHKGSLFFSHFFDLSGRSDDWGNTWTSLPIEMEGIVATKDRIYGLADFGDQLVYSENKGVSFQSLTDGLNSNPNIESLFSTDDQVFILANDQLYRLVNDKWEPASSGLFDVNGSLVVRPTQFVSKDNIVVMTGSNSGQARSFYISFDNGQRWTEFGSPKGISFDEAFIALDDDVLYITGQEMAWADRPKIFKQKLSDFSLKKIEGIVFEDLNGNGEKDQDEPPLEDVLIQSKIGNSISKSKVDGSFNLYSIFVFQTDTLAAIPPSTYAEITTPDYVIDESSNNLEFGVQFMADAQDLCISLESATVFRPGFQTNLTATVSNVGTRFMDATVELELPDFLEFIGSSPMPDQVNGNVLVWEEIALARFESLSIGVTVRTPVPQPINSSIDIKATVKPIAGDRKPENNVDILSDAVVGSFDPNDKSVSSVELSPDQVMDQTPLEYRIRFQNTGNYPAEFIHILDTLDTKLDFSTFEILGSSHAMNYSIGKVGELDFFFDMINLPDSTSNEAASHGFVKYKITPKTSLVLGDIVQNSASIYFDYNAPIHTNSVETVVQMPSSVVEKLQRINFQITPNPTVNQAVVEYEFNSNKAVVSIVNLDGKIIWREKVGKGTKAILPKMSPGTYFVNIKTSTGFGSEMWQVVR